MFVKPIQQLILSHISALNNLVLPIQKNQSNFARFESTDRNKTYHYGIPFLFLIVGFTFGTFYLPAQAANFEWDFWSFENFYNNPYVATHQISPPSLWRHFEIASIFSIIAPAGILLYATIRKELPFHFQIKQISAENFAVGNRVLDVAVSQQIRFYQRWIPLFFWSCYLPFFSIALIFYYYNLLNNAVYSVDVISLLFWTVIFPVFIFYTFYGVIGPLLYIIVSSRILRIRQVNCLQNIKMLKRMLVMDMQMVNTWDRFMDANTRLLHICWHIDANSRLNNPVLSILFPYLELVQPFLLAVLLYDKQSFVGTVFCLSAIIEVNVILFLLTKECSTIDRVNGQIEGVLRKFNFYYAAREARKKESAQKLPVVTLLKAQVFQLEERLKPYTYCVYGYSRIVVTSYFAVRVFAVDWKNVICLFDLL